MTDKNNELANRGNLLMPSSRDWEEEVKNPEHKTILEKFTDFRQSIFDRLYTKHHPNLADAIEDPSRARLTEQPGAEMAYKTAAALSNAIKETLQDPLAVANISAEKGDEYGEKRGFGNYHRRGFMLSIIEAMELMNITPQDLAQIQRQSREISDNLKSERSKK